MFYIHAVIWTSCKSNKDFCHKHRSLFLYPSWHLRDLDSPERPGEPSGDKQRSFRTKTSFVNRLLFWWVVSCDSAGSLILAQSWPTSRSLSHLISTCLVPVSQKQAPAVVLGPDSGLAFSTNQFHLLQLQGCFKNCPTLIYSLVHVKASALLLHSDRDEYFRQTRWGNISVMASGRSVNRPAAAGSGSVCFRLFSAGLG